MLSSLAACLSILLALLIHEAGHLLVSRMVGERIEQIELTPFGGIMTYAPGTICHKGIRGICVHSAGPFLNYAALLLSCMPMLHPIVEQESLRAFAVANASMFLLNLLPVLPLDGGHVVFCIGYYFFPVARLVAALSILGVMAGIVLVVLSLYGFLFRSILNCSLLMIGVYIACQAKRNQNVLLAQNVFSIVQERLAIPVCTRSIRYYQIQPDAKLISLLPLLKERNACRFIFEHKHTEYTLGEDIFCQLLLKMPSARVSEAYFSQFNKRKNA